MSTRPQRQGRRVLPAVAAAAALATAVAAAVPASAAPSAAQGAAPPVPTSRPVAGTPLTDGNYVVTLIDAPAASYDGRVPGLPRTAPGDEDQLDASALPVQQYRTFLAQRQDEVLAASGVTATHRYTVALNGFAARLSAQQAARLAGDRRVLSVVPDSLRTADTTTTPEYLGLPGPDGAWSGLGGRADAGTGVVVGVLDTGITPENPMFRGQPVTATSGAGRGDTYRSPDGGIDVVKADGGTFEGTCQAGPTFPRSTCDSTIVSAQYFGRSFLAANPPDTLAEFETVSPRDGDSHGTHTASTALGRSVADLTISGNSFGRATGMAPAAKLSVYKVLWESEDPESSGGFTSDIVEAVDQAVEDGVDVINYSIGGGSPDEATDPVELAFLSAASAGIFVAASAGNDGPGAGTVDKNAPWVTSVAASTVHRFEGTVRLGNGRLLRGESLFGTAVPETAAVLARNAGKAGSKPDEAALCFLGTLDPAKVRGKIVVCDRGVNDRVEKSEEVGRAGGVGMVLVNVTTGGTNADKHSVPTVHLEADSRQPVLDYFAADRTPTIALLPGDKTDLPPTAVPVVAGFSGRGPSIQNGGDLLKPDITAPGVNILAAVAPGPSGGDRFGPLSGTSMSSPHIAGLAALLMQAQPKWSPMKVKSALMTTSRDLVNPDGTPNRNPFDQGAGFVEPTKALEPGLVYDSHAYDWLRFLEGTGVDTGTGVPAMDPSDANQASIAVGELAGTQTVTRRVTATTPGLYRASADIPGVAVTVSPSVLNFSARGETKEFTVTFRRTTAALDSYATGFLTWRGAGLSVRSPMAVQPVAISAPAEVTASRTAGSTSYEVVPGATGPIDLTLQGLVPGQVRSGSVEVGPLVLDPTGNAANEVFRVSVPEGTSLARFDLAAKDERDDMDLFVIDPGFTTLVGASATGAASEQVDLQDPAPGDYYVIVNGFAAVGAAAAFDLRTFAVPDGPTGTGTVSPDPLPAEQARPSEVTVRWSGLQAGRPYLGVVRYGDAARQTVVAID